jgi:hypothetical protein
LSDIGRVNIARDPTVFTAAKSPDGLREKISTKSGTLSREWNTSHQAALRDTVILRDTVTRHVVETEEER